MTPGSGLVCPKCGCKMRPYDRSGILVEQCEDCRWIYLDQGELERLIEAEGGGWSGRVIPPAAARSSDRAADDRRGRGPARPAARVRPAPSGRDSR